MSDRLRLALVVDTPRRVLGGAKTLSYAGNMLAKRLAVERGFDEALLVTPEDASWSCRPSFFYVDRDGILCTPPLSDEILDSVTRRVLFRRLTVEERPARASRCWRAERRLRPARRVRSNRSARSRPISSRRCPAR